MQMQARQLDRLDRQVIRSYLRLGEGVSRYRVESSLEEALRMAELPGEREGRVYFFRRVVLGGLDGQTNRRVWMECLQGTLSRLAAEAVHGTDPRAPASDTVYFNNREQALETLLREAIRPRAPEWFAAAVLGLAAEAESADVALAALVRLRENMPPAIAGEIVFAAARGAGPGAVARLLEAVPEATARDWVSDGATGDGAPVPLSEGRETMLIEAARHFGWKHSRTVWLAALAASCANSGVSVPGSVIRQARAILRALEAKLGGHLARRLEAAPEGRVIFDENPAGAASRTAVGTVSSDTAKPYPQPALAEDVPPRSAAVAEPQASVPDEAAGRMEILGEPTQAAGLYFLLHVLRRLRIEAVIEASPALAEANLAAHVLYDIALRLGVAEEDPILLGLKSSGDEFALPEQTIAATPRAAWPANLAWNESRRHTGSELLRVWILAVRRWCWREAGLTAREIVERRGTVWITRTDLDVTLPLKDADVRIRRVGLDIDPGWVPWLGVRGRVVRFHYRESHRSGARAAAEETE
jgi:hypothetical protein